MNIYGLTSYAIFSGQPVMLYRSFIIFSFFHRDEMNLIWVSRKFLGMLKELSAFSGRLVTSVVIVAFLLMDNQISAAKIFPMLSLFTILSHYMMDELSWFIQHWLEIGVSVSRIQVQQIFGR